MLLDETTQLTKTVPGSERLPFRAAPASRAKLHPVLKLTRAHIAVNRRGSLARGLASATSRVAQRLGPQLKTTLSCRASLLPATMHPFSHLATKALFISLDLGGEALAVLELDLLGVGELLAKITGGQEPAAVPARLTSIDEAALGWVVLAALAEVRAEPAFAAMSPRLVSLSMDRGELLRQVDATQRHVAIQLELELGGLHAIGRVLVPAHWVQARFEATPIDALPPLHEAVASATVPTRCYVGNTLIPAAEIDALAVGDVVLLAGSSHGPDGVLGPGRLVASSFELRGTFSGAGFTLTRALERPNQEPTMSIDPTVPVEVEVELTRLRLPLGQLGSVQPGSILPLHVNAAQQVVLRIGDKPVARAELVELEGELGARIVSML